MKSMREGLSSIYDEETSQQSRSLNSNTILANIRTDVENAVFAARVDIPDLCIKHSISAIGSMYVLDEFLSRGGDLPDAWSNIAIDEDLALWEFNPNVALSNIRVATEAAMISSEPGAVWDKNVCADHLSTIVVEVYALNNWLSRGGALPDVWQTK